MSKASIGTRVGAMRNADDGVAYVFGFGTYQGEEVPPPEITFMGTPLANFGCENPKIVLDDGTVVWGCECWWGPEEVIKRRIAGKKIEIVSITDFRAEKLAAESFRGAE